MTRTAVGLAVPLALLAPTVTRADFHNEIDLGQLEIEHNGDAQFARKWARYAGA